MAAIALSQTPMSFFSVTLDRLLPEHDLSPADLARETKIAPSLISRYRSGVRPEAEALEKIADAFGDDGLELIVAWLRDSIPERFRHQIALSAAGEAGRTREKPPTAWERLNARERRLFESLAQLCQENSRITPLLEQVLNYSQPG